MLGVVKIRKACYRYEKRFPSCIKNTRQDVEQGDFSYPVNVFDVS